MEVGARFKNNHSKTYKNLFEIIKKKPKKPYYSEKLIKYISNAKKTWSVMREPLGKSSLNSKTIYNNTDIFNETKIAANFNDLFANIC